MIFKLSLQIYSSFEMTENMHATSNVEYLQNIVSEICIYRF